MRFIKIFIGVFFLLLMALLPLRASQFLGRGIGRLLYFFKNSRSFAVSKKNIALCQPNLSTDQQEQLLLQSLQHTGMSYAEMGMSWLWPTSLTLSTVTSVKGEQILKRAVAKNKGVIIIAPHIGNWEVLNLFASQHYAITVLYKQPKLKFFDWLINKMRKRLGGDMAPANASGVRKLMKKLKTNGVIAILPDQEPAEGSGAFASFFGRPAYTMTLLSQLARKTQCEVISGVAIRQEHGKGFAIEFSEVNEDVQNADLDIALMALNQCVERISKLAPAQYQWEYKRFKKAPQELDKVY